jgi:hypothetical protein
MKRYIGAMLEATARREPQGPRAANDASAVEE